MGRSPSFLVSGPVAPGCTAGPTPGGRHGGLARRAAEGCGGHGRATLPFDPVGRSPESPVEPDGSSADFPDWVWASGEETSDPLVHVERADDAPGCGPVGGRVTIRVDELGGCGHLEHLDDDLAAVGDIGATVMRYGMPWQRTELEPGVYDWSLWDRALAAAERVGLEVVVDLCHFGLPDHLCGPGSDHAGFTDPAWVDSFLRYVEAFLARYPGPRWFTPVNEPTTTAFCSALWGAWNDGTDAPGDYGRALVLCELADALAAAAIRADRPASFPGAEALSIPTLVHPGRSEEAEVRVAQWNAATDLRTGHPLDPDAESLFETVPDAWFERLSTVSGTDGVVLGHDIYPVSVQPYGPLDAEPPELTITDRVDAWADFARRCHRRWGLPIWVAETSNLGLDPADGPAWLDALSDACALLRLDGVDVRGICWYSRGDQLDWDNALVPPDGTLTRVGLFDMERRPRPAAEAFRRLAAGGAPPAVVGRAGVGRAGVGQAENQTATDG